MAQCNATPGCTGQIADGYCDQCGSAPLAVSQPKAQAAPVTTQAATVSATPVAPPATNACACGGGFVDGFCDTCGNAPTGQANAPTGQANQPAGQASTRSHKTGSTHLSGRTGSRRGSVGSRLSGTRRNLGLGLVTVPDIPKGDPLAALMKEAKVPDNKRVCTGYKPDGSPCETPLTKREKGFCPTCRTRYNFIPGLDTEELVAGQYRVKGCIAFGGMGWIYLCLDETLNRYVVLKGLVNQDDKSLADAAVAERQFLAEVKHANIVSVYTCVQHTNAKGSAAYTVMEYVGGKTLKSLRKAGPLPVGEVLAYMYPVLGAFGYLHANGLIYNDFKPDNCMVEDGDIKVIDLGGVCRVTQTDGDIYSTVGYAAPELATTGPSFASDLYTIGRTIAVLCTEFRGYNSTFEKKLRSPSEEPVYQKYDSLYRFLQKACHENPSMRFQTAAEMSEQLVGVMRVVVAVDTGKPCPSESTVFGPDTLSVRDLTKGGVDVIDIESLPKLKMTAQDSATSFIVTNLGSGDPRRQTPVLKQALTQFPESVEAKLAYARNQIRLGNFDEAEQQLVAVEAQDAFDWRVIWYRGMALIAQNVPAEAVTAFTNCYNEVPGELAPRLAIALACELAGDAPAAIIFYEAAARIDPSYATAAFGLARCHARAGDRAAAVEALARIPQTSSLYVDAQKKLALVLINEQPTAPGVDELTRAAATIEALVLQGIDRVLLLREFFSTTLRLIQTLKIQPKPAVKVFGQELAEMPVRLSLEQALRELARLSHDPAEKIRLVDQANQVRPRTLI